MELCIERFGHTRIAEQSQLCYIMRRHGPHMSDRSLIILLSLGCLSGAFARETDRRRVPPGEVICGYSGNYFAIEASRVKEGLSVQLLAGDLEVSRPAPLRFRVCQMPQGTAVDDLQVEHEKLM